MGHGFTGLVREVGARATGGFAAGDRVVMAHEHFLQQVLLLPARWPNLCVDLAPMGFSYPGGMAQQVVIPARAANGHVLKTPATCPLTRPVWPSRSVAPVNSLGQCGLEGGDTVLVLGEDRWG